MTLGGALNVNGGSFSLIGGSFSASLIDVGNSGSFIGYGTVSGAVAVTGGIEASGGTLDFAGAVTVASAAAFIIENGATLEFDSSVATGAIATFAGTTGMLDVRQPANFNAEVSGISASGDVLDLGGFTGSQSSDLFTTSATYNSVTNTTLLTVADTSQPTDPPETVTLVGNYSSSNNVGWTAVSDGSGGADVTIQAPAVTIASGATLTVDTPTASDIVFLGSTGALDLAQPSSFTGEIAGFTGTAANSSSSDVIDLAGINYNSGSFSENYNSMTGVLTVSDGTNSVELTFIDFTGTLKFASDGTGGTDIYDPPATGSCEKSVTIGGPGNDNFVFHPANATDTSVHWNAQQATGVFDHIADAELGRHLALFITGGDGDAVTEYGYHDASALPDAATTQLQQIAQAHYIHSH